MGCLAQQRLRIIGMYNTFSKVWTGLPGMLVVVRSYHSLVVVQGRLVVIGGYQDTQTTSKVDVLGGGVGDFLLLP